MDRLLRCAAALLLAAAAGQGHGQGVVPAAPAAAASAPTTAASAASGLDKRVIEDKQVRIEEVRVRGQTKSITVQSKLPGMRSYEIVLPPLGKDPSQEPGAAGQRTWSLLHF